MKTLPISQPTERFYFTLYIVRQKLSAKQSSNYRTLVETASFEIAMSQFRRAQHHYPERKVYLEQKICKSVKHDVVSSSRFYNWDEAYSRGVRLF